jgi:cytochrome P450
LDAVSRQPDTGGELLDPKCAAVELLNVIRPTVAVAWFVAFTGHALHRWPEQRARLREAASRRTSLVVGGHRVGSAGPRIVIFGR